MTYKVSETRGLVLRWRSIGNNVVEYPANDVVGNMHLYRSLTAEFGTPTGIVKNYKVLTEL